MTKRSQAELDAQDKYAELSGGMAKLRDFAVPPYAAHPDEVHRGLVDVRAALDLAETLIQESARFRDEVGRRARALAQAADDAYDAELVKMGAQGSRPAYEGAQERYGAARMNHLVFEARRRARTAERVSDIARGEHERLRTSFYGLLNIREELLARLRELQWESSMER